MIVNELETLLTGVKHTNIVQRTNRKRIKAAAASSLPEGGVQMSFEGWKTKTELNSHNALPPVPHTTPCSRSFYSSAQP